MDALKLWLSWQAHGDRGYEANVDGLFELAAGFREALVQGPGFRLVREPASINICFTWLPPHERYLEGAERRERESLRTVELRRETVRRGRYMVNYALIDGVKAIRVVVVNPRATLPDLVGLLDEIETIGAELT